jgi:hypothetical protein
MKNSLEDAHEQWLIMCAKNGNREDLVTYVRSDTPMGRNVRDFLADILEGKAKLKRKRKLSWRQKDHQWLAERLVYECAEYLRQKESRKRQSTKVRGTLIDLAKKLGFYTDKNQLGRYSKTPKSRRPKIGVVSRSKIGKIISSSSPQMMPIRYRKQLLDAYEQHQRKATKI